MRIFLPNGLPHRLCCEKASALGCKPIEVGLPVLRRRYGFARPNDCRQWRLGYVTRQACQDIHSSEERHIGETLLHTSFFRNLLGTRQEHRRSCCRDSALRSCLHRPIHHRRSAQRSLRTTLVWTDCLGKITMRWLSEPLARPLPAEALQRPFAKVRR